VTGPGSQVYWTADARDAELRLTQQTAGNGVVTTQGFDALTDRLTSILAGTSGVVENFSYTYDVLGNVLTRSDANESLTETLTYDNLNRLTQATVTANIAPVKTFSYSPIGNLLSKSDVGTYTYPLAGAALPHAVSSITQRQPDRRGRPQHQLHLLQQAELNHAGVEHAVLFPRHRPPALQTAGAGGHHALLRCLRRPCRAVQFRNFAVVRLCQQRRGPRCRRLRLGRRLRWQVRAVRSSRHLRADVGLVHLNGRIYDPLIARMMSADPMVPDPMNGQAWNRYSYVINNPGFEKARSSDPAYINEATKI
jgi:RHS repeat-associated protein